MPLTIIGDTSTIRAVIPPLIELRQAWADPWRFIPGVELVSALAVSGGQDLGRAVLQTRYGQVKELHKKEVETQAAKNYMGWWVRISLLASGSAPWNGFRWASPH